MRLINIINNNVCFLHIQHLCLHLNRVSDFLHSVLLISSSSRSVASAPPEETQSSDWVCAR